MKGDEYMTGIERLREIASAVRGSVWANTDVQFCREHGLTVDNAGGRMGDELRSIADQIEAEQEERITRRLEDREAAEWVRERGGIAYVRDAWRVRSSLDRQLEKAQAKVERQQRHIESIQRLCRERRERICEELNKLKRAYVDALNGVCKRLGLTDGTGLPDMPEVIWTELDRRLMPEGMAWPRFDTGEPVRIGDEVTITVHDEDGDFDRTLAIRSIKYKQDGVLLEGTKNEMVMLSHGERVKRPAPKVLDADGAEIRMGDSVWDNRNWDALIVRSIGDEGNTVACRYVDVDDDAIPVHGMWMPSTLTHRAPVIAADGKPLEVGQTVWPKYPSANRNAQVKRAKVVGIQAECGRVDVQTTYATGLSFLEQVGADRLTHRAPVPAADGRPLREGETVYLTDSPTAFVVDDIMTREDGATVVHLKDGAWNLPQYLTHERPDSWKRIEEDARKLAADYWGCFNFDCDDCPAEVDGERPNERFDTGGCGYAQQIDIVRRAKALAKKEQR